MKLFQAFLVITIVILINIPGYAPDEAPALPLPVIPEMHAGTEALSTPSIATLSPDSLQKRFERAVWNNDVESLETLIKSGADVNGINREDGYAALHWAVERRLVQTVNVLLANGADIDVFTSNAIGNDRTALHIASELGYSDIVRILLEQGADINKKTVYGESPLHGVRLFIKSQDVVQLLIAHGADVNAMTTFGTTPLHSASLLGEAKIAQLLIAHGAKVDTPDQRGLTPLHHAALNGHDQVIKELIEQNVNIDAQTRTGDTAMHLAAKKGHSEATRLLLNQGANPLSLNKFSKSPLSEAKERAYENLVEMLGGTIGDEQEG